MDPARPAEAAVAMTLHSLNEVGWTYNYRSNVWNQQDVRINQRTSSKSLKTSICLRFSKLKSPRPMQRPAESASLLRPPRTYPHIDGTLEHTSSSFRRRIFRTLMHRLCIAPSRYRTPGE